MYGYVDASGSEADPSTKGVSAAGFIAKRAAWQGFERGWCSVLSRFGILQFGMGDWANLNGAFKPWRKLEEKESKSRRRDILAALLDVAASTEMYGAATYLDMSMFHMLNLEFCALENCISPYAVCAALSGEHLKNSDFVRKRHPRYVKIFAEEGDANQHRLLELVRRNPTGLELEIKPKKHYDERGKPVYIRQFELADMFAFEHRKFLQKLIGEGEYHYRPLANQMTQRIDTQQGTWTLGDLRRVCMQCGVPKRFGAPPPNSQAGI
jgi:hypothetical protein